MNQFNFWPGYAMQGGNPGWSGLLNVNPLKDRRTDRRHKFPQVCKHVII